MLQNAEYNSMHGQETMLQMGYADCLEIKMASDRVEPGSATQ